MQIQADTISCSNPVTFHQENTLDQVLASASRLEEPSQEEIRKNTKQSEVLPQMQLNLRRYENIYKMGVAYQYRLPTDPLPHQSVPFLKNFFGINNDKKKVKEQWQGREGALSYLSHLKILYSNL